MKSPGPTAARIANALLRACCGSERVEELEGDLLELYEHTSARRGRFVAQLQYWREIFGLCLHLRFGAARGARAPVEQAKGHAGSLQVFPARILASLAVIVALFGLLDHPVGRMIFWAIWVGLSHLQPHRLKGGRGSSEPPTSSTPRRGRRPS